MSAAPATSTALHGCPACGLTPSCAAMQRFNEAMTALARLEKSIEELRVRTEETRIQTHRLCARTVRGPDGELALRNLLDKSGQGQG